MGNTPDPEKRLFYKTGVLKVCIGQAHKGWTLVGVNESVAESSSLEESRSEAMKVISAMYDEAEDRIAKYTFLFARRRPCSIVDHKRYHVTVNQ